MLFLACYRCVFCFFFFNDTATTEIYTLSLHDALPISLTIDGIAGYAGCIGSREPSWIAQPARDEVVTLAGDQEIVSEYFGLNQSLADIHETEEHTSELQSPVPISYAVFCLKKKKKKKTTQQNNDNKSKH